MSRVQSVVTVKPLAPSVNDIAYCQNATAAALSASGQVGATFKWYTTIGGTASLTAPIPSTSSVGTTNYYVTQTVNSVESNVATITVTVNPATATPSVVSGNTSVITLSSETYSVTSVANTSYQWTLPSFMSGSSATNSITASINAGGSGVDSVVVANSLDT